MKYKEFRDYLTLNEIYMEENKESLIVDDHIKISKIEEHKIVFLIDIIDLPYEHEMLKKSLELAETPLSEREEEKRCYIKHKFLNDSSEKNYINLFTAGKAVLSDRRENQFFKTKFTKAEIEELKARHNTDLRDFEFIEAEED